MRSCKPSQALGDEVTAEAYSGRLLDYGAHSKESARTALDQVRSAMMDASWLTPIRPDTPPSQ